MGKAYSIDFRNKVMGYINSGNSCYKAAKKFEISHGTATNWKRRQEREGHYESRKVGGKKGRVSEEEIANYVKKNPDFILSEMGKEFKMSAAGALYWLRKLKYSYKKKPIPMWKQTKKKELNIKS